MDLILKVSAGNRIHITNFGPNICGLDGSQIFDIIINDQNGVFAKIPNLNLKALFTKFDLKGTDFLEGNYHSTDYFMYDPIKKKVIGKTELGFKLGLKAQYSF